MPIELLKYLPLLLECRTGKAYLNVKVLKKTVRIKQTFNNIKRLQTNMFTPLRWLQRTRPGNFTRLFKL